ncbi:MAG: phosphohydrolase [Variovorax paradoxus]|nr:MAG: phosphohydrolase [Variovorax paradoxus]PZQ09713.1 MAG: phosphohydrolase [Variovorax paradoxus]
MARPTTESASGRPHLAQLAQILRANWRRWAAFLLQPRKPATAVASTPPTAPNAPAAPGATAPIRVQGAAPGWLRVLPSEELLQVVQADKALREIWRRTRLAQPVWQRDCLSAIHRYAEFVQLLPASEAHHHAHAGGLLAHTIEMLLAALAWRGGRLLPEGAPIEIIDAQRDEWTLVVFYSALLHDIAKPMSDLMVSWRTVGMADGVRWQPMSGSLNQVAAGKTGAEYLVEFTPKSLRDYRAHSRLAMLLLPHIASPTALAFLARQPAAFEALQRYLSGEDKDSLVARIVREADKASTRRALQHGSRARVATATAVPLVDLLMQAVQDMLRKGTELPLNRSGAAAWVFEDSIWFVAKRLADATRSWIKANAPDEAVPGDDKNDRLFDTWQEYGCLVANPQSGQAIWYVTVHGQGEEGVSAQDGEASTGYAHSLSVLRFPLSRVYADPEHYPPAMRGSIEVLAKRGSKDESAQQASDGATAAAVRSPALAPVDGVAPGEIGLPQLRMQQREEAVAEVAMRKAAPVGATSQEPAAVPQNSKPANRNDRMRKAPAFNKPKAASSRTGAATSPTAAHASPSDQAENAATVPHHERTVPLPREPIFGEFGVDEFLDPDDAAEPSRDKRAEAGRPLARSSIVDEPDSAEPSAQQHIPAATFNPTLTFGGDRPEDDGAGLLLRPGGTFSNSGDDAARATRARQEPERAQLSDSMPQAVLLRPNLPKVPNAAGKQAKATDAALEFMRWVQTSLVDRSIKYNESGAVVHFVPQGMALVSPLIFKLFAENCVGADGPADEIAMQVQKDVIRAGWHMAGPNRTNIIKFTVHGRGDAVVGRLAAVVLCEPGQWVQPVPPSNPALRVA